MIIINTDIEDVKIIQPTIFHDERGFFFESFNKKKFQKALDRKVTFVQDNQSLSRKGVIRGLHYQQSPHQQGKLVRVIKGEIYDVAVDIRENSSTFRKWVGVYLSSTNRHQLWVPEGFAHGFMVMSNTADVLYKTTEYWHPDSERTITWSDPILNIEWPITEGQEIIISEKDKSK